jgi:hypothetical protein
MYAFALRAFLLIGACIISLPALAGVGGTSAGIDPTIGIQGTNPSPDVQSQSTGFVAQNQQLQNAAGQNGNSPPVSTTLQSMAPNQASASATQANAKGNPQDPSDPKANGQAPAQPAAPPPPPPTYVSVVKHLKPDTASTTDVVAVPVTTPAPAQPPAHAAAAVATPSLPAATPPAIAAPTPATPTPRASAKAAANAANHTGAEHTPETSGSTGGSGDAPDGYTFCLGLGIAALLLAIALSTYLRAQRDETVQR